MPNFCPQWEPNADGVGITATHDGRTVEIRYNAADDWWHLSCDGGPPAMYARVETARRAARAYLRGGAR